MGYLFTAIVFSRHPRALLALSVTLVLGLYIYVQVRWHEAQVRLEQRQQQQHVVEPQTRPATHALPATAKRKRGRE